MEYLIISSCLLGNNVKYNGKNNYINGIEKLKDKYNLIVICPEVMGGLSIPRIPSEIKGSKVINKEGLDVTSYFNKGREEVLKLIKDKKVTKALLKDGSPSCGSTYIYDGTFNSNKIKGYGVCALVLKELGIKIYTENNYQELL